MDDVLLLLLPSLLLLLLRWPSRGAACMDVEGRPILLDGAVGSINLGCGCACLPARLWGVGGESGFVSS